MRQRKDNNDDNTRKNEDLKGKGGGRLKHYNVDGDVPLCLRKTEKESNDDSSSKGKAARRKGMRKNGERKQRYVSTFNWKKRWRHTVNKEVTFIRLQKNMRSMHSSEGIEGMVCELEGYRWDAILLSETWRPGKSAIWETHHKHIFMEAGKYDNKHGVGIMLNKRWRQRIIETEYINERAITATIVANRQRIKLMSVYFSPTRNMRTITSKKCTKRPRNTWRIVTNTFTSLEETSMLSWYLVMVRNVKLLAVTFSTRVTKEVIGWQACWCYKITPPSTRCSERHLRSRRLSCLQKGNEKQIDYI